MPLFHFEFKVQPASRHHTAIKLGFAHVYIKAGNLIEGRLRAQMVLADAHFVVLELMDDGEEFDPQLHDPPPAAKKYLDMAEKDGVAIYVGGIASGPIDKATEIKINLPKPPGLF